MRELGSRLSSFQLFIESRRPELLKKNPLFGARGRTSVNYDMMIFQLFGDGALANVRLQ